MKKVVLIIAVACHCFAVVNARRDRYLETDDLLDDTLMIECPTLECTETSLVPNVCYQHDGNP